jgi:hypothetical protein
MSLLYQNPHPLVVPDGYLLDHTSRVNQLSTVDVSAKAGSPGTLLASPPALLAQPAPAAHNRSCRPNAGRTGIRRSYRSARSGGRSARTGTGWRAVRVASPSHSPPFWFAPLPECLFGLIDLTFVSVPPRGFFLVPRAKVPCPVVVPRASGRRPEPMRGPVPALPERSRSRNLCYTEIRTVTSKQALSISRTFSLKDGTNGQNPINPWYR